jgi:hypothetical protein
MLTSDDSEFYASILNSLVQRRPFFLKTNGRVTDRLVKHVFSFVPAHRYLLVAGTVPRWAKFLASQPRELQNTDLEELMTALKSTFEEERMGRRPVQFIYFGADTRVYEAVLKTLPTGWIATTDNRDWLEEFKATVQDFHEFQGPGGISALHLGVRPMNLNFEMRLLERAKDRHEAFATFLIQMKFTQLHLAGAAVLGEWEERAHSMTMVDLEEDFELDALNAEKMVELAQADYGLEVARCLKLADPRVIYTAEGLARMDYVNAVAVAEDGEVVWAKRVAAAAISVSCLASHIARLANMSFPDLGFGKLAYIWISSSEGQHAVAMRAGNLTYVIILAAEAKPALTVAAFSEMLGR